MRVKPLAMRVDIESDAVVAQGSHAADAESFEGPYFSGAEDKLLQDNEHTLRQVASAAKGKRPRRETRTALPPHGDSWRRASRDGRDVGRP